MTQGERLFFGVRVTPDVSDWLTGYQAALQKAGVRAGNWSPPDLFHVTLLFLGVLPSSYRPLLAEAGRAAARIGGPFGLRFTAPGTFERNRILWMGLAADEGLRALTELHRALHTALDGRLPAPLDTRPYRAHLTLARKLDTASFRTWADELAQGGGRGRAQRLEMPAPSIRVDAFHLFASMRMGGRLVYPVLETFELQGAGCGGG